MPQTIATLNLTNSFSTLGEAFFSRVRPTPFTSPTRLVHANERAVRLLDLPTDIGLDPEFLAVFSGKQIPANADPISMLYAGHQFGHYVPQLGDGRAIILAEATNRANEKWELQLKGSGLTPYSRDGDGRAVLRSTIREYLCSEAMLGLGIPTTQALCIVAGDDEVYRESIEPGAMLTRMAPSHVRFGSFEVFFYRDQYEHIRTLADYVIEQHFADLAQQEQRYALWLEQVIDSTAFLIAQWQAVGFSHGVMNSDNMSILGLTIDYGPYGFMQAYDPGFVCNHSDYHGRYAFDQQPEIGLFNLTCLAQALLPLFDANADNAVAIARDKLAGYQERFIFHYAALMRKKLGLQKELPQDQDLLRELLDLMAADRVDYTILFRRLSDFSIQFENENSDIRNLFLRRERFDVWARQYRQRLHVESQDKSVRAQNMKAVNPKFILRNYMAEVAIRKAQDENDYTEIDTLMRLLRSPYDEQIDLEHYAAEAPDWAAGISVSCSS